MHLTIDLPDEAATEHMASRLASVISAPLVLGFSGEIGAGKTTLIRAMLRSLGITGAIKSPTYALVESYTINLEKESVNQHINNSRYDSTAFSRIKNLHIHHFDLYRIQEEEELDYIGFRDYFTMPSVCCIEWPERIQKGLDCIDLQLTMTMKTMGRELLIHATSTKGSHVLSLLHEMIL